MRKKPKKKEGGTRGEFYNSVNTGYYVSKSTYVLILKIL